MSTRLTPQALQPGSSFCLPFLTPFKGVSMPLEDGGSRLGPSLEVIEEAQPEDPLLVRG